MLRVRLALLLSPLLLTAGGAQPQRASSPLDHLAWLSGTWRTESEDGSFMEETWSAPLGDAMCGMFRSAGAKGEVSLYEMMAIERDRPAYPPTDPNGPGIPGQDRGGAPERLIFRLRHFDRGLIPWKSDAEAPIDMQVRGATENELLLESPDREFPHTASYRRDGELLTIRLASREEGAHVLEFRLQRVQR